MKYVLLQAAMAVPFVTLFIIVASFISALILSSLYNLIIYILESLMNNFLFSCYVPR